MKIKRRKLVRIMNGLQTVKNLKGVKFAYAVVKNSSIIKPEIEAINEASKGTDDFNQYEKDRLALCVKYAEKDSEGNSKMVNTNQGVNYKIEDDNIKAFTKELEDLNSKNKIILDAREEQMKQVEDLLNEEIEVEFHKINADDLPEEISASQLELIEELID